MISSNDQKQDFWTNKIFFSTEKYWWNMIRRFVVWPWARYIEKSPILHYLLHSGILKTNKIKKCNNNRMWRCGVFFFGIYGVVRHSNTRLKHISSFSTTLMSAAYRSTLSSQYHSAEIIYFLPIWRFIQKNLWSFEWFLCNVNKCFTIMSAQQRMKVANEKASKNITSRGNIVKPVRFWLNLPLSKAKNI